MKIGTAGIFSFLTVLTAPLSYAGAPPAAVGGNEAVATFAGGCFWYAEADFEKLPGVSKVISGFSGGRVDNPTYEQVALGKTGHVESVQIYYDPGAVSYEKLVSAFWRRINPADRGGQFGDRGDQYRSVIFYRTDQEKAIAERSRQALAASGRYPAPIVTEIRKFDAFYPAAEDYQDYYQRNPIRYRFYRYRSGRDQYLHKLWEAKMTTPSPVLEKTPDDAPYVKPSAEQLEKTLTPLQYKVTQHEGTEPPFQNAYWNEKREGIYVDVVSGEPLFSSLDKFDSGTGWPSFTKPLVEDNIVRKKDFRLLLPRTEVRSRHADSHLGHVFDDGPNPTGLRYCMNSAALRFIPKEELERQGYGRFLSSFK